MIDHDAQLRQLVVSDDVPWGYRFGDDGRRPISVNTLLSLARQEVGDIPDLERRLDDAVREAGGERADGDIDLDHLAQRFWCWLRRRPAPQKPEFYVMPRDH